EAANNASAAGTLLPLLTLGLPTTATAAIILVAVQGYGIQPGPQLLENEPQLVWGLLASLIIANALLLVINLPMAPLWAKLLQIPRPQLYAGILFFATLGAYTVNFQAFDLALLLVLGLLGLAMRRFGLPVLPLVVGVILGPALESKLTEALAISQGDVSTLWSEPVAVAVYAVMALMLLAMVVSGLRGPKDPAAVASAPDNDRDDDPTDDPADGTAAARNEEMSER
ncbi:MAG TPA: tripartite tricarboxylate transporter permease, partial [Nocardioidaceae bacterium]|nr:tripartite tricarboxylate transporter permease [Nocardioidaceae bacterium]